jgi:peptidoglycan hydrolase FlgJ
MAGLPLQPTALTLDVAAKVDAARAEQQEKADAAVRQVEGLFLGMMLKEMRNTLEEGSLFGGDSSDVYGGLFDLMLSKNLSDGSPLGLSQLLQNQLVKTAAVPDLSTLYSLPSAGDLIPASLDAQF